ncbi:HlyD family secretion protein [Brucella pituitosa]|uniref:HlyD family secretion protein n=1 Tax=Brucella pituitosa TaxID=571256 RepID=UPI002004E1A8|nr:biotin/lipoyl-binding protein [Brucella pituitosa]MCK4207632.1 HlyD family secretion protein [Brucella pituitosa]
MFELLMCSMLTIFPDYLIRRYIQNKRIGRDITLFTVWYELRWGISACVILTISLITLIFYFHPSTKSATAMYRTVSILPERTGRVIKVFVNTNDKVEAGQPLFQLDTSEQQAAAEAAKRKIAEVDAQIVVTLTTLRAADGTIQQAQGAYQQALDELKSKQQLMRRDANVVAIREIERLQVSVDGLKGAVEAAKANKQTLETQISTLLPAQKESAQAALAQEQVELDKRLVRAGIAGTLQQFTLRPGDVVTNFRPAGILVPTEAGRTALVAGFGQIESQVLKAGMIAEATCISKPFTIIPMAVVLVQDVVATGQFRPTDELIDVQKIGSPGSITAYLEPLYVEQLEGVPPGGSCIANVYTNNYEALAAKDIGTGRWIFLHVVDTVGLVHAMILRLQAMFLPVQALVLSDAH